MADGKRYYWLKLRDDFFTSKRIKKLRKIEHGDTYIIIYLKMQLKAMYSNLHRSDSQEKCEAEIYAMGI